MMAWKICCSIICMLLMVLFLVYMLTSCAISMQNISTHGTASDLVDDQFSNTPKFSPNLSIPLIQ